MDTSSNGFAELAELSPDGILVNQDDQFVYANPAALSMLGAAHIEQVVGRSVFDFIPPQNHALVKERIARVRAGLPNALREGQLLRLDGTALDVEITAAPVHWHERFAIQVLVRDIGERKRMQQDLRDSEERFRALVEQTRQAVAEWITEAQLKHNGFLFPSDQRPGALPPEGDLSARFDRKREQRHHASFRKRLRRVQASQKRPLILYPDSGHGMLFQYPKLVVDHVQLFLND
jgi:PAS domain S-box-containing protein